MITGHDLPAFQDRGGVTTWDLGRGMDNELILTGAFLGTGLLVIWDRVLDHMEDRVQK